MGNSIDAVFCLQVVSPSGFPWIAAAVVTCTTMMIHNIYPVRCSLFVLAYDVLDSLGLFFEIFVTGRLVLNELVMKKLALFRLYVPARGALGERPGEGRGHGSVRGAGDGGRRR